MYLSAGDGLFAIVERVNGGAFVPHYIHKDHLGSIQTITNKDGKLEQRWAYDAWGLRSLTTNSTGTAGFLFDRGYTMHEHLETFKLINMNGRVYDPILGRFLSPDNFVQDAGSTQAYNRYTYCLNNPLAYTDPSGWISTETMPFQWIAPTYYYSSFFQPKFGAFAGDNYAVEYFSNFHNGGSHLAGAEGAGNFRSRGFGGYTYDWNAHHAGITGVYRNSSGEQVGFAEVFTNYIAPLCRNVAIFFGKEATDRVMSLTQTTQGNWHIIFPTSYENAYNQLSKYCGDTKLDNLLLEFHGNSSGIFSKFGRIKASDLEEYANGNNPANNDDICWLVSLAQFVRPTTADCEGGNIIFGACRVAIDNDRFGDAYSKLTGNQYYICVNRDRTSFQMDSHYPPGVLKEEKNRIYDRYTLDKMSYLTSEKEYNLGWRIYSPYGTYGIKNLLISTDFIKPGIIFIF